ncbi:MAG TPA: DUF3857 domain-containing protein, partial [Candidatus Angelobacter sp.]|nr:DUF3857 domain-containing protein [Candidatus Angelobacter sp.]
MGALVVTGAPVCYAQQRSEEWLPVTATDWQVKEVPGDPGAAAIQLYYADFRDDTRQYQFIYRRIKILVDTGRSYANVEIPVPSQYSISGIQARTIHPDGHIVDFAGKPIDKTLLRTRDSRIVAKELVLPQATAGSIVEYKYRLEWDKYLYDPTWPLQHDLYTVKESFWLKPYEGHIRTRYLSDDTRLSYVYSNLPAGVKPKETASGIELEAQGVPSFRGENYMPPEDNYRSEVRFFYGGREIESPEIFWRDTGKLWFGNAERFIGNHPEIRSAAITLIGSETDPEGKLRRLYARAQQVRNLSYERERTRAEERKEALKANESALDVLLHDYGSRNEIAELFAALARAAGFHAELLRASSRQEKIFDPKLLSEAQLGIEIVRIKSNGLDLFLDPGTEFCPFGLVPWMYTSVPALKLARDGGDFILIPTPTADKNVTRRTATLTLDQGGSANGQITLEFKGNTALQHRLNALDTDEAGNRARLEAELKEMLPENCSIQFHDVEGIDRSEGSLIVHFSAAFPALAAPAGRRLLLPASVFQSKQLEAFRSSERRYPVYFPFGYEEIDQVKIQVPQGYAAEGLPAGQDVKLTSTRFITTRAAKS